MYYYGGYSGGYNNSCGCGGNNYPNYGGGYYGGGPAYGIGNPDDSDGEYIWDLVSFTNSDWEYFGHGRRSPGKSYSYGNQRKLWIHQRIFDCQNKKFQMKR